MKKLILLGLIAFFATSGFAQSFEYVTDSNHDLFSKKVYTDPSGNVYVIGNLYGSITLDGAVYESYMTYNGLIIKYDQTGEIDWVLQASCAGDAWISSIQGDKADGILIAGYHTADVVLGDSLITCYNAPLDNGFLISIGSDASIRYCRNLQSDYWDAMIMDAVVDKKGNKYFGAITSGDVHFEDMYIPWPEYANNGSVFIKANKFSVGQWYAHFQSTGYAEITGVAVDKNGNSYVAGACALTLYIDGILISLDAYGPETGYAYFLFKFDPFGNIVWYKIMEHFNFPTIIDLETDPMGDVYWMMNMGDITIDGDYYTESVPGMLDNEGLVAKFDGVTGDSEWVRKLGSYEHASIGGMQFNREGRLFIVGEYREYMYCDDMELDNAADLSSESFVLELDRFGSVNALYDLNTAGVSDGLQDVGFDAVGNMYLAGFAEEEITLGGFAACPEGGSWTAKVQTGTYREMETQTTDIQVYPNPATDQITVHVPEHLIGASIQVISLSGGVVITELLAQQDHRIQVDQLPVGLYTIRLGDTARMFEVVR